MKQPPKKPNTGPKAGQKSGKKSGRKPGQNPKTPPMAMLKKRNQKLREDNEKLRAENEALKTSITQLVEDLDIARNDIKSYVGSTSWRITKPMRVLKSLFK